MNFKLIFKEWIPPGLIKVIRFFWHRENRFVGNFSDWYQALAQCSGYDSQLILNKVLESSIKVKNGEAAYERDSVVFNEPNYNWTILTAIMWSAAQNGGRLNVLDFGGALGSLYFQNRTFFDELRDVRWSIVEQPHFVAAGKKYIQDDTLKFYNTIDECLSENDPCVVLLSSVIQYLPDENNLLDTLNRTCAKILIIDRTPFNSKMENDICIQIVTDNIYSAKYPMRILSFQKVIDKLSEWSVFSRIPSPEGTVLTNAGLEFGFEGIIFKRKNDQ
jgi:putative methyltransferase (TIGR04325 family)